MSDTNLPRVGSASSENALAAAAASGPDEPERIYYEGSPMVRGEIGKIFIYGLIGAALIAIPILWMLFRPDPGPAWWVWAICIVLGLIIWIFPVLLARSLRYRISSYRIDFERGIFGKTIDTMELWHVDDIKFRQSFIERILGVGTIQVMSDDQTTPELNMRGLPNPRPLFEAVKQRVISIKRSRGVVKIDSGS